MVDVTRTFTVSRARADVAAYLRDFANATEWDPGTVACTQATPGPVAVGTEWNNTSKLYGISTELTYRLEVDEPGHIVLKGTNKTATSTDDITLNEAGPSSTEITYHANIEFNGLAKLADPLAGIAFERVGKETEEQMIAALEKR
ncbi:polyketide cyclase [Rhodococcus sp. Leaf7]|uniref:SRPBCC family protein n=1 Tax=unclassified Rhodococcus (in: high G+C Gram-positive bacteria) TaxID=192944 RepID=UPI0006F815C2|nr:MULTISPECIES: SRPBCC family protein [unclassified Rhodococcus (in: high G+C Gram-positive bacteria)]KQU02543.1 polyketide cyclase [Rhodococcus sp. Leaf7]KQU38014.1 polyketide cyclase [Rhodococcus sp. Leaf247]